MTDPLNIIFNKFGLWLQGYRIEFSCLYIPQGHHFISTLWLWCTDEYMFVLFQAKVHLYQMTIHVHLNLKVLIVEEISESW